MMKLCILQMTKKYLEYHLLLHLTKAIELLLMELAYQIIVLIRKIIFPIKAKIKEVDLDDKFKLIVDKYEKVSPDWLFVVIDNAIIDFESISEMKTQIVELYLDIFRREKQ